MNVDTLSYNFLCIFSIDLHYYFWFSRFDSIPHSLSLKSFTFFFMFKKWNYLSVETQRMIFNTHWAMSEFSNELRSIHSDIFIRKWIATTEVDIDLADSVINQIVKQFILLNFILFFNSLNKRLHHSAEKKVHSWALSHLHRNTIVWSIIIFYYSVLLFVGQ